MKLSDFNAFGFDVDHTLAVYNIPNLFERVHSDMSEFLVKYKGYDESMLRPFSVHKDLCSRGLIMDMKNGNVLKVGEDGVILRAYHGVKKMASEDIIQCYGKEQKWPQMETFLDKVNNINPGGSDPNEPQCVIFDNFYDMIGIISICRMVEIWDQRANGRATCYDGLWQDVVAAYSYVYHPQVFADDRDGWFSDIKNNPEKYLNPCSEQLKRWLQTLKKEKKFLFLLTSSYVDFASHSMKTILGDDWRSYFNVVITNAKKPGFFTAGRPYKSLDVFEEGGDISKLEQGEIYSQGNHDALMKLISESVSIKDPKVLYFGDSIRSDMCPVKMHSNWKRVFIMEEIVLERFSEHHGSQMTDRDGKVVESHYTQGDRLIRHEYHSSDIWGSFFHDLGQGTSTATPTRMNTMWGRLVGRHSDIAIPHIDYITDIDMSSDLPTFTSETDLTGFYPFVPLVFK